MKNPISLPSKTISIDSRRETIETACFLHKAPIETTDKLDFLQIGLRNDIRVRSFIIEESRILVHFWTIENAISFYQQYIKILKMEFELSASDLKFELSLPSESEKLKTNNIRVGVELQPIYCNVSSKNSIEKVNMINNEVELTNNKECADDSFINAISILQVDRNRAIKNSGRKDSAKLHNKTRMKLEESVENKIKAYITKEEKRMMCSVLKKEAGEKKQAKVIVKNNLQSLSKKEKYELFCQKIRYFKNMKNFFSKNDVKQMEMTVEKKQLDFLFLNSKEVSCGSLSNIIIQQALKIMNESELCKMIECLGYDIGPISATKYGAYTIQNVILHAKSAASHVLLSKYFEPFGGFLITHEIGNYALQKLLKFDEMLVYKLIVENIDEIAANKLGVKVFKKCFEFFKNCGEPIIELMSKEKHEILFKSLK